MVQAVTKLMEKYPQIHMRQQTSLISQSLSEVGMNNGYRQGQSAFGIHSPVAGCVGPWVVGGFLAMERVEVNVPDHLPVLADFKQANAVMPATELCSLNDPDPEHALAE